MKSEKFMVSGVTPEEKKRMEAVFHFTRDHINEVEAAAARQEAEERRIFQQNFCPGGCGVRRGGSF